jgi:hypothetical protein
MATPAVPDTNKLRGYPAPQLPLDPAAHAVFLTEEFRKISAVLKVMGETMVKLELRLASGAL